MDDFSFQKKGQDKQIRSTPAIRTFLVSIILLVIPLFLHSLWMYRHYYQQRKKDLFLSLNILGESRAALIEQVISSRIDFLELTSETPFLLDPVRLHEEGPFFNAFLRRAATELEVSEVFYMSFEEGNFTCSASSVSTLVDKNFNEYTYLTDQFGKNNFVLFGVLPFVDEKRLIIGKTIVDRNTQQPIGMLVTSSPATALAYRLAAIEDSPYVIDLCFLMDNGIIFGSSDPRLTMQSIKPLGPEFIQELYQSGQLGNLELRHDILTLEPVKNISDAYQLIGKQRKFVVITPVRNAEISVLLGVSVSRVFALQQRAYLYEILSLLIFIVIFGGGGTLIVALRISKPLKKLIQSMEQVSQGNYEARFTPDKMGFEINIVGEYFNHMIESIIQHEKQAREQRLAKERLARELQIGYEIQMSMLPSKIPELPGLDIATGFVPAREVCGDFYDLFVLDDGKMVIVIADTAGKGIPACLYSLGLRSMLRSFCLSTQDLSEIVKNMNKLFCKDTKDTGVFVTLWVSIYDPTTHLLKYCNMGHHPAILKEDGKQIRFLTTENIALGVEEIESVEESQVTLKPKDRLILYTDGIVEAQDMDGKLYGQKRFVKFVETQEMKNSKLWVDELLKEIESFRAKNEYSDDLTVMHIHVI